MNDTCPKCGGQMLTCGYAHRPDCPDLVPAPFVVGVVTLPTEVPEEPPLTPEEIRQLRHILEHLRIYRLE